VVDCAAPWRAGRAGKKAARPSCGTCARDRAGPPGRRAVDHDPAGGSALTPAS